MDPEAHSPLWDAELIGGPEHAAIEIVPADPRWPLVFAAHRTRIATALVAAARRIEHVGSTAVPGLPAKPIVDVQVSVRDVEDEPAYVPALERAGYVLRVREPGHRMLRTPARDVHVHVCAQGSGWERRHLLFRDWLRVSAADRDGYARAKRALADRAWPTMNHYADAKTPVIAEITARAEAWAERTGWAVQPGGPVV